MKINENKNDSKEYKSLRIVIIEPRGRYCRVVCYAIALGISHIMFGATVMTVFLYHFQNNDLHATLFAVAISEANVLICTFAVGLAQMLIGGTLSIILSYSLSTNFDDKHAISCVYGYHFFSVEAILSLNYANGWSTPMRLRHRRLTHVFLNICAMICAIIGTVIITLDKGLPTSPHGLTGFITALLSCITFLLGPCALFGKRIGKIVHASFGMPTFLMSSVSFCCGLFTQAFQAWAPQAVVYILLGFIIFYTTVIMALCFLKCTSRI